LEENGRKLYTLPVEETMYLLPPASKRNHPSTRYMYQNDNLLPSPSRRDVYDSGLFNKIPLDPESSYLVPSTHPQSSSAEENDVYDDATLEIASVDVTDLLVPPTSLEGVEELLDEGTKDDADVTEASSWTRPDLESDVIRLRDLLLAEKETDMDTSRVPPSLVPLRPAKVSSRYSCLPLKNSKMWGWR
jgi:hypothetical protein